MLICGDCLQRAYHDSRGPHRPHHRRAAGSVCAHRALPAPRHHGLRMARPLRFSATGAVGGSGLRSRARDLARFGSVYLHKGQWRGRQVIPTAWVERSVRRQTPVGDLKANSGKTTFTYGMGLEDARWSFGYQWWLGQLGRVEFAAAVGLGNQRVFVVPSARLVVTILAGEYNKVGSSSEQIFARVLAAHNTSLGPASQARVGASVSLNDLSPIYR